MEYLRYHFTFSKALVCLRTFWVPAHHHLSEFANLNIMDDIKFCTLAATYPSLQWDTQLSDWWLECITMPRLSLDRWPCPHCNSTTKHFPERCPFRPGTLELDLPDPHPHHNPILLSTPYPWAVHNPPATPTPIQNATTF